MSEALDVVLGFDPGGKGGFGWSVCSVVDGALQPPPVTGLADEAKQALGRVCEALKTRTTVGDARILAAGIDAPLYWSYGSGRRVDDVVREALRATGFPTPSGTVQHFNSLKGSCTIQGAMLAKALHESWEIKITETHPKALEHLLKSPAHLEMLEIMERLTRELPRDRYAHERDATLSALAAWAMHGRAPGWRNLRGQEPDPVQPFGTPVSYWMPIP